MSLKIKSSLLVTTLLVLLSVYSYGSFSNYKPKDLIPLKEVKGSKDGEEKVKLPYPENYKILGTAQKEEGEQVTYRTSQGAEEIQTFYRNILLSKEWEIDTTGKAGIFTTTKYRKEKKLVEITTSKQSNEEQVEKEITIVSVLIKN